MKKIVSLLCATAMLVSSLAFFGCQGATNGTSSRAAAQATGTGEIIGVVLDNRGEPVEGATVTLGNKTAKTNFGGEFVITDVNVNTNAIDLIKDKAAYTLTAKKDGYLSATVTGVYVSYEETQESGNAEYQSRLQDLRTAYTVILNAYATKAGAESVVIENNSQTEDTDHETTIKTDSYAYEVMQTLADSLDSLKDLFADQVFFTNFYSTFANATLIPLDASLKGKVKLNLKAKGASTYDEKTYAPASKPTVHVSYAKQAFVAPTLITAATQTDPAVYSTGTPAGIYTWAAEVDENGNFSFKNLPSGVPLDITVDSFFETIDDVEYVFSSESSERVAENTSASAGAKDTGNSSVPQLVLGSGDANVQSLVFILFAQNDKIWITSTNADSITTGKLLKTTDPLTFTFNKAMKKIDFNEKSIDAKTETKGINLNATEYTLTWSDDNKTATVTPNAGYWTITGDVKIVVSGEGEDGTTTFLKDVVNAYFDTKVWVSLKTESLNDFNDHILLSDPIVVEFSKPMNEKIALTLNGTTTAYTETWNDDKTVLTLTPAGTYWKVTGTKPGELASSAKVNDLVTVKVTKDGGSSKDYYNKDFGYWKNGAVDVVKPSDNGNVAGTDGTNDELHVYFDKYVDVTTEKAEVDGKEAITLTFSKELKSFSKKDNIDSIKVGTEAVTDYDAVIDSTNKVVTISSKNAVFAKEGYYTIVLKDIEAKDGSDLIRKIGNKDVVEVTGNTTYVEGSYEVKTSFKFDGFEFKPTKIEIVDSIPSTAAESRAIIAVTTDKVLKITFTKDVAESKITVDFGTGTAKAVKNYIEKNVVYIPLDAADKTQEAITLGGVVYSVDDVKTVSTTATTHSDEAKFNDTNLNKWFDNAVDTYKLYSALNLEGTSLIKGLDHVTGKPEYTKADPISAGGSVTFTFDADLDDDYVASYKIFGLKDVDNDAATDIKVLVENGVATIAGKTVTVTDTAFKTKKTVGDIATYYVELRVDRVDAEGKVLARVFSSTNPYFGSVTGSFEALTKATGTKVYDAPKDNSPEGLNDNKNYGSFIVEVAEKNHLVATNLIKETKYSLTKSAYAKADALPAKSAITFTFDSLPADATASYELYDIAVTDGTKKPQVVTSGAATIDDKVVTVKTDLLVSGNPTVEGKVFNVVPSPTTGISDYFLKLEVKDAAGNVFFSSANKVLAPDTSASGYVEKRTDFEKAVESELLTKSDSNAKDMFKVEVAPLAVESLSWVKEDTDAFGTVKLDGDGKKTYKEAEKINPKAEVTITFNATIPAHAKYSYKIKEGTTVLEETKTALEVASDTKEIKIKSDKMVAKTTKAQDYDIELTVLNGNDKIFATDSTYFGNASNFETKNKGSNTEDKVIRPDLDAFRVKVIQTQVITKKVDNVESKTTKNDDFQKTHKTPIVLQFSHDVTGYSAVLYQSDKLYTDKTGKTHALTDLTDSTKEVKIADFKKDSAEYIFDSDVTVSGKELTITPKNFFDAGKTINIAVFDADGKYLYDLKDDTDAVLNGKYTTKANTGATHDETIKLVNEMAATAGALGVDVPTATDKIGNNQKVVLSVKTAFSSVSQSLPTYELYVKKAEGSDYEYVNETLAFVNEKVDGVGVSVTNYKLGRAGTSYYTTTIPADACDYYGETAKYASYVLLEKLDGKVTAYKTAEEALKDVVGPELTTTSIVFTNIAGNVAVTSDKTKFELQGSSVAAATGTNSPTDYGAGFTMTLTSPEVVRLATVKFVGKKNTGVAAGSANTSEDTTATVKYDNDSKVITVTFKGKDNKTYVYLEDVINIELTDVSGVKSIYSITIK